MPGSGLPWQAFRSCLIISKQERKEINLENRLTCLDSGGHYILPYIEWAYTKGIIHGIGNDMFAPDRLITREEIALILQNYATATGYTFPVIRETISFVDNSSIGSSYRNAVKAMQ